MVIGAPKVTEFPRRPLFSGGRGDAIGVVGWSRGSMGRRGGRGVKPKQRTFPKYAFLGYIRIVTFRTPNFGNTKQMPLCWRA